MSNQGIYKTYMLDADLPRKYGNWTVAIVIEEKNHESGIFNNHCIKESGI